MRWPVLAIVTVVVGWTAYAQSPNSDLVIRQPFVEVRGGRSSIFPVSGYLRQGQTVRILREENGWLAIAPPAGSSSWVMERVLDRQPNRGQRTICVALADDAPLMLGTPDSAVPQPHQVGTVKRGTMIVALGEKAESDVQGEKAIWWRIQPLPSEVRWIAKASVQKSEVGSQRSEVRGQPTSMQPVARPSYAPVQPTTKGVLMTSGPGNLRRAAFQIDGQPAFVLEDFHGYVRVYAVAQPGLNLEPFINRRVELFGPLVKRPEFTGRGYLSVNRVHLLR